MRRQARRPPRARLLGGGGGGAGGECGIGEWPTMQAAAREGAAGVTAVTPAAPGGPAAPGVCSRDAQATSLLLSAELWASEHDELKRSADAQRSRSAAEG